MSGSAIARALEQPTRCRDLPARGGSERAAPDGTLFGFAPRGVCTAVPVTRHAVSSYLTISPLPCLDRQLVGSCRSRQGGIFSVALSVASPGRCRHGIGRPAVSWHVALWSSDVPPIGVNRRATARHTPEMSKNVERPACRLAYTVTDAAISSSTMIRPQCSQVKSCSERRNSTRVCGGIA